MLNCYYRITKLSQREFPLCCFSNCTAVNEMLRESKSNQITGKSYHLSLVTSLPLRRKIYNKLYLYLTTKEKNLQQTLPDNRRRKHNKHKFSPRFLSLNMYHSLSHNNLCRCLCLYDKKCLTSFQKNTQKFSQLFYCIIL
jgi:hypothetical protein